MSTFPKSKPKFTPQQQAVAARVLRNAAEILKRGVEAGDPDAVTRFEAAQKELHRQQEDNARLMVAAVHDGPLPVRFYAPWVCYRQLLRWSKDKAPGAPRVPWLTLNRKVCVEPSKFFEFMRAREQFENGCRSVAKAL